MKKNLHLPGLNFPENYHFRFKEKQSNLFIFCILRKQWLQLTPEEWVRQNIVQYLIKNKKYNKNSIVSEYALRLNHTNKRADLLVFKQQKPFLLVEAKAPNVALSQTVFEQVARYNSVLQAKFLLLSNGIEHQFCEYHLESNQYKIISQLPDS